MTEANAPQPQPIGALPAGSKPAVGHKTIVRGATSETSASSEATPALLGALQGPEAKAAAPSLPDGITKIGDPAAVVFYKTQLMQIQYLEEKKRMGVKLDPSDLDLWAISHAVKECMEQQRYYYIGPKENLPSYSHLQSDTTRYIATTISNTGIVIELPRTSYPAVFDHYKLRAK